MIFSFYGNWAMKSSLGDQLCCVELVCGVLDDISIMKHCCDVCYVCMYLFHSMYH
jgi:hypothetical protein